MFVAAEQTGVYDEQLDEALSHCHRWFAGHAASFLAASVWAQAVAMTFRPDLDVQNPGLFLTAEKFVRLLDAAEVAERELAYADVGLCSWTDLPNLSNALPADEGAGPIARRGIWLPEIEATVALAAQASEESIEFFPAVRWRSPDGHYEARLVVPRKTKKDSKEPAVVTLHWADDGRPWIEAGGVGVMLAGVQSTADAGGQVTFSWESLRAVADQEAILIVGPDDEQWHRL